MLSSSKYAYVFCENIKTKLTYALCLYLQQQTPSLSPPANVSDTIVLKLFV